MRFHAKRNKHSGLETVLSAEVGAMSCEELEDSIAFLRDEANRLIAEMDDQIANDTADELQNHLELRYGAAFTQWVMDRLPGGEQFAFSS